MANRDSHTVSVIEQTKGGYRNIANVSTGISPYKVFVEDDNTYVIKGNLQYPVSIIGESFYGDWRNVRNISLVDPSNIQSIAVSNDTTYVGYSYSPSNHSVSIIEDLEGDYRNITSVYVGFSPKIITAVDNFAYVTDPYGNTVSVISQMGGEYRNIANVTVGNDPLSPSTLGHWDVAINDWNYKMYVVNSDYDNVSIYTSDVDLPDVDLPTFTNIANVTVGADPTRIAVDGFNGFIYVTNFVSKSVSVIKDTNNKLQVGVSFEVELFHAGYVNCKDQFQDDIKVPTNQYFYIDFP